MSSHGPPRPPTPQVLVHRQPDKPELNPTKKPSKYIILIMGSTSVAGKLQITQAVAKALSCPLFYGDSLHESTAKAATVGASRAGTADADDDTPSFAPNEIRYQRMWLSRLTRTGLLFPEESRPAAEGFAGFGGDASTSASTIRRGSASSVVSAAGSRTPGVSPSTSSRGSQRTSPIMSPQPLRPTTTSFPNEASVHNPVFTVSEAERCRRANPALLVLGHPQLEHWHKLAIRNATREFGIRIIFVPLYEEEGYDNDVSEDDDLPILRPFEPRAMTSFATSFGKKITTVEPTLDREMNLSINASADVAAKTKEIIDSCRDIIGYAPTSVS